jgi:hypothetical protein
MNRESGIDDLHWQPGEELRPNYPARCGWCIAYRYRRHGSKPCKLQKVRGGWGHEKCNFIDDGLVALVASAAYAGNGSQQAVASPLNVQRQPVADHRSTARL